MEKKKDLATLSRELRNTIAMYFYTGLVLGAGNINEADKLVDKVNISKEMKDVLTLGRDLVKQEQEKGI